MVSEFLKYFEYLTKLIVYLDNFLKLKCNDIKYFYTYLTYLKGAFIILKYSKVIFLCFAFFELMRKSMMNFEATLLERDSSGYADASAHPHLLCLLF